MITNDKMIEFIDAKDYNSVIDACDSIIYHYLHKTNFWNIFPNDRDDLVQEGRIAVYKCALTYDKRTKFTTYVHNAVRNSIYNYVKKMKLFDNINMVELDTDTYNNSEETTMTEVYENVLTEMLNNQHLDILHAYFVEDYTQQDIADKMNLSQQWIGTIINNFKRSMKDKYGYDV
jgi:RNA polymerase sigma factor (sigma-70 family)